MAMNGAWKQCPNGHWYDSAESSTCPQCAANAGNQGFQEYGPTMPLGGGGASGGLSETQPVAGGDFQSFPPTEPVREGGASGFQSMPTMINFDDSVPAIHDFDKDEASGGGYPGIREFDSNTNGMDPIGPTVPVNAYQNQQNLGETRAARRGTFSPVVGWLVCVEGVDRGRDYRIHAGYNSIGRSESMDIFISGDDTISRDRHARIAYDPEERIFFFAPAEGRNLVRINGKLLMQPTELHAYDIIGFNTTKLMFVPFCGERFDWDAKNEK